MGRSVPGRRCRRDGRPQLTPALQPDQDPARRWCAGSCGCGGAPARAGPDRRPARVPASTVHAVLVRCRINRLSHIDRVTGEPLRRYEHPHPGSLIHVDVTKFGNIPDGGGHKFRQPPAEQSQRRRDRATAPANAASKYRPLIGTAFVHTVIDDHSRRRLRRDLRRREGRHRDRGPAPSRRLVRRPRRHRRTRPVRQRHLLPVLRLARRLRRTRTSRPSGPGPTGHRPTARSSDSTAPWPTAGPTPGSTNQHQQRDDALPGLAALLQSPPRPLRHRRPTAGHPTDQRPWTSQLVHHRDEHFCSDGPPFG